MKNTKCAQLKYEEIQIGKTYSFNRTFTKEDVASFANLTGDHNPLHTNPQFAAKTSFGRNIVHGMLSAGLFSTMIGMICPGQNSLYLTQTLKFKKPIYLGDQITIQATVIAKNDAVRTITLRTEILKDREIAISGEAQVGIRAD